jgi:hypothetical protein
MIPIPCNLHFLIRRIGFGAIARIKAASNSYGASRADGPRGQPLGCGSRQPIGEIGGKADGKDNQVGYDTGMKVKRRKIHAVVDSEGLPMRVVVHSAAIPDRDVAGLVLDKIRTPLPLARTDLGRRRLQRLAG